MSDLTAVKGRLAAEVDKRADVLVDASHQIHAHPELCYEEHFAHDVLTGLLEADGLEVERHAFDLDTAFIARAGTGDGPTIAVLCEYDALRASGTPAATTSSARRVWARVSPRQPSPTSSVGAS